MGVHAALWFVMSNRNSSQDQRGNLRYMFLCAKTQKFSITQTVGVDVCSRVKQEILGGFVVNPL